MTAFEDRPKRRPVRREGQRTGPPDYVGVGAQRSGTSWWHELIGAHPHVHRYVPKESHFFDEFCKRPFGERDVRRYHSLFPRPPGTVTGEWTPRYAHDMWTPPLLKRAAPDARLLFIVRDPVERYRSGLALRASQHPGTSPLMWAAWATDAAHRGLYALQLRRLLTSFPSGQILVLQYEQCIQDPAAELRRTYRFLGLDDSYTNVDFAAPRGILSGDAKPSLPNGIAQQLVEYLEADVRDLARIAPEVDVALWPSFAHVQASGPRSPRGSAPLPPT